MGMKNSWIVILLVLVTSCGNSDPNGLKKTSKFTKTNSLFNMANYFSDAEQFISFPIWFNDSLLKARNIKQITRSIYGKEGWVSTQDSTHFPQRRLDYFFGSNGNLMKQMNTNYYDNRKINAVSIHFSNFDPILGHAETTVESTDSIGIHEFRFQQVSKVKKTKHVTLFKDKLTGNGLFVVSNSAYWKPLAIDSACKPTAQDRIIWGSYQSPIKKYFVKNLVEESDVRNYVYEGKTLKKMEWKDDPFEIRRTFLYTKEGYCKSFVDSTFGMGTFISATKYQFTLKDGLPVAMKQSAMHESKEIVLFRERFDYIYR
jgi:hypothetical protein